MTKLPRSHVCCWIFLLVLSLSAGCRAGHEPDSRSVAKRPKSVPSEAVWVGGVDGGVYVLISRRDETNDHIYFGEIYYDGGKLWYKGKLYLESNDLSTFEFNNSDSYSGWDGDTLYLKDGRSLRAMDKME